MTDLTPRPLSVLPVVGLGEVRPGDDLAALLVDATDLRDGDIVVVTSKVVSKAEGRVVAGSRESWLASESDRVVARRGATVVVRTRHGLVLAGAGIDASNTPSGTVVLLPSDPDASARALREAIAAGGDAGGAAAAGPNVAVLVTDTAGRAWRTGQTDIAVGAAGIDVLQDYAGRTDPHGNPLTVTAPAVADEIAGAADLVKGKLAGLPAAVLRGLAERVLPRGEHGPGAAALVREEGEDMFGLGSREAVTAASRRHRDDRRGFPAAADAATLAAALADVVDVAPAVVDERRVDVPLAGSGDAPGLLGLGQAMERLRAVGHAHGWGARDEVRHDGSGVAGATGVTVRLRFQPDNP